MIGVEIGNFGQSAVIPNKIETGRLEYFSEVGDGEWFWVATGIDTAGNESNFTPELTAILDTDPPPPPPNFRIVPVITLLLLD